MLSDDDFRRLSMPAQHLYMMLLIHPTLSYAGVADWRAGRIAALTAGSSREQVEAAARELQGLRFIYVDHDTEEVLIRSFVRHDGLLKQYRLPVSMANDYAGVASSKIRSFFAHELKRLNAESPNDKCWEDARVAKILDAPSDDLKAVSYDNESDGALPIGYGDTYGIGSAEASSEPMPSATSTATTTATSTSSRRSPERPLPADWRPTEKHGTNAEEKFLSIDTLVQTFKNHAETHDRRCRNWDAAFSNWILKADPGTPPQSRNITPQYSWANQ
jgi:hypothetical protein